jgi:hypothetical protein
MTIVATPTGAALICGQCGARYEFPPSYDRRLPLSAALDAGWGTARIDKGDFDNGAACAAPAMKGSLYCQAYHPGRTGSYGLSPWEHGKRCKAVALSTKLPCKRAVMRGYTVCASHGGKAGEASKPIMAAPYDPVAAYARKVKRERHRQYTLLRNAGQAPPPVKERANCKILWARGYNGLAVRADIGFCKFALGQTVEWP